MQPNVASRVVFNFINNRQWIDLRRHVTSSLSPQDRKKAAADILSKDHDGATALMCALARGCPLDICKSMATLAKVEHPSDIFMIADRHGQNAMHYVAGSPEASVEAVSLIVAESKACLTAKSNFGYTPYMKALTTGINRPQYVKAVLFLEQETYKASEPPFMSACRFGSLDDVISLSDSSSSPSPSFSTEDSAQRSPFQAACSNPKFLLEHLQQVFSLSPPEVAIKRDKNGLSPLDAICLNSSPADGSLHFVLSLTPSNMGLEPSGADCMVSLHRASSNPAVLPSDLSALLAAFPGAASAVDEKGCYALHYLCETYGKRAGADDDGSFMLRLASLHPSALNAKNAAGSTPLHSLFATWEKAVPLGVVQGLVALCPEALQADDADGNLPLHVLASNGYNSVENADVFALVARAFPPAAKAKNAKGNTALHLAARNHDGTTMQNLQLLVSLNTRCLKELNADGILPIHYAVERVSEEQPDWGGGCVKYLFRCHPVSGPQFSQLPATYLADLEASPPSSFADFSPQLQHGWVTFASSDDLLPDGSSLLAACLSFVGSCSQGCATTLARALDVTGRTALTTAVPPLARKLQARLLFLGRYDLLLGPGVPVVHKSATCMVVKGFDAGVEMDYRKAFHAAAIATTESYSDGHVQQQKTSITKEGLRSLLATFDVRWDDDEIFEEKFAKFDHDENGSIDEDEFVRICKREVDNDAPRNIVIKFMKNEAQYMRELRSRLDNDLNPRYVISVSASYDANVDENFRLAMSQQCLGEYRFALVMPGADRNLDAIFRSERPDINSTRSLVQQIAEAVAHLHARGISHGDIKLLNVVRFNGLLRLIDLDASVSLTVADNDAASFYAGGKFSSGVLPPEMIHNLRNCDELLAFDQYFAAERGGTDTELWLKVCPKEIKVGQRIMRFAVKTFKTEMVEKDGYDDLIEQPVSLPNLPYVPEKSSPALDIWSLGALLYQLVTGFSLFNVNRDDDLISAESFQELHGWSESKKVSKLKHINHSLVKDLLSRILSADPKLRPRSMEEVLAHPFFATDSVDGSLSEQIRSLEVSLNRKFEEEKLALSRIEEIQRRVLDNTIELKGITEEACRKIDNSASVLCQAIFEATEVNVPTCFVILPYKIPDPNTQTDDTSLAELTAKSGEWLEICSGLSLEGVGRIDSPQSFASNFLTAAFESKIFENVVKSKCVKETLYLYLVDEYSCKPVFDTSTPKVYPLAIDVTSSEVAAYLPLMRLSVQACSVVNGAAAIANLFFPFVPSRLIPSSIVSRAESFVDSISMPSTVANFSSVQSQLSGGGEMGGKPKRGAELRDFEAFLNEKDPKASFAGLRRVCDKSTGNAIWVTEESKVLLQGIGSELSDETRRIKAEMGEEIKRLKDELESFRAGKGIQGAVASAARRESQLESVVNSLDAPLAAELQLLKVENAELRGRLSSAKSDDSLNAEGSNKVTLVDLHAQLGALRKQLLQPQDNTLSPKGSVFVGPAAASTIIKGFIGKKGRFLGKIENRHVELDSSGRLFWDGGVGHRGFMQVSRSTHAKQNVKETAGKSGWTLYHDGSKTEFFCSEDEAAQWVASLNNVVQSL